MWPDRRLLDLLGIDHPIIQAPMAGAMDGALVAAVSAAGGLGSLPCAMLNADQIRAEVERIRARTDRPFGMNFFCHVPPVPDNARISAWHSRLAPYYSELGLDPHAPVPVANRTPFDAAMCELVLELKPRVTSFHFGLPEPALVARLKGAGCIILSSATTVAEARWLAERGADAVIAQGQEAGGHRGIFLSDAVASQVGTFALVPQVADAVSVPVIAAGGIADGRGVAAAFTLGASGVQVGTAYLLTPEAKISAPHRAALAAATDDGTVLTNVFTGRPARALMNRLVAETGPISDVVPPFPLAAGPVGPLRAAAEKQGSGAFSPLWSGQAAALAGPMGAADLTRKLATDGLARLTGAGATKA